MVLSAVRAAELSGVIVSCMFGSVVMVVVVVVSSEQCSEEA
jgi:hypothetical protein